jgi:hypothetical protein
MAATNPKQELHDFVDRLSEQDARRLASALIEAGAGGARQPRPLTRDDIILPEPIMPDDETADDMIETIRRWRREGGYA